nr:MAG TPA: restriction alleviation protein [Caudoviricetes sp.]
MEKIALKPGETCPFCGQTKRRKKTMTEKQIKANQKNGLKGGRPKKNV